MAGTRNGIIDATTLSRLEEFRKSDIEREDLVKGILDEYYRLNEQYRIICRDYENEMASRRTWHQKAIEAKEDLELTHNNMERNPFVLVLIDGDGVLFNDEFLTPGSEGGSEAAHRLSHEIRKVMQDRHENTSNWKIMVHIYANFEGLSKRLCGLGIIDSPARLHAFSRAFSMSQPFFSFLDVGSGKEYADHKIKEMFQLFLFNVHCKHIMFGGAHDNGYLTMLNQYKREEDITRRMTILESTPAERGYHALGFPIVQFTSVFRDQPLPETRLMALSNGNPRYLAPSVATTAFLNVPTTKVASASQNIDLTPATRVLSGPQSSNSRQLTGSGSVESFINGPLDSPITPAAKVATPTPPAPSTYASIGKADVKEISIARAKSPHDNRKYVLLNANNERLDPKLPKPDKESQYKLTQRIKIQKVCNDYHLLGKCYKKDTCEYSHGERLPLGQQLALRVKARQRQCTEREQCRDPNCVFGHVCPNESCPWDNCHFKDYHAEQMDMTPAIRIYEDDTIEDVR